MYVEAWAKPIKETAKGTVFEIVTPRLSLLDRLKRWLNKGWLKCEIKFDDGRSISSEQRRKAYATIRDISDWNGDLPEYLKEYFKYDFMAETGVDYFSLSDCSVTTARHFISHIVHFCLVHGVPLTDLAVNRTDDADRYFYDCLMNKRCAHCGKDAVFHHVDRVGMGRNREEICHLGMSGQALCPVCHDEVHMIGQKAFDSKYHIYGIKADKEICRVYNLNMIGA